MEIVLGRTIGKIDSQRRILQISCCCAQLGDAFWGGRWAEIKWTGIEFALIANYTSSFPYCFENKLLFCPFCGSRIMVRVDDE